MRPMIVRGLTQDRTAPGGVTVPGCAEERDDFWIVGAKVISERGEHRDKYHYFGVSGKDAELVKDVFVVPRW